ncbi:MAG: alpha-galactosidase [Clostridia bacterium]|nr:alpha-galactosidase [Clostridia bacterium]
MYDFDLSIRYKADGREKICADVKNEDYEIEIIKSEGELKYILHPAKEMELVSFSVRTKRAMAEKEVFFVNGFQSWSTSLEVYRGETLKGVNPVSGISSFTKHLASMSGDCQIIDDYGKAGHFHSFTYTYFRNADSLELFGSMNERTGYTIFAVNNDDDSFTIIKDVEGAAVNGDYELLNVRIISGAYDEVFDDYFGSMNLRKPGIEHLSGYTSWYNYFQKIDEKIILRDLDGLDRVKDSVSIFQIDDGYETFVGDWLDVDPVKFPRGMKVIADKVHEKGYLAGIWVAPFSVQRVSKTAKEHPDWLIKNAKGKPEWGCFAWGGAYTIDMYNPEVREYIKHFFDVILHDWGYDMVKLDFLYSQSIHPRDGKSRGQIMCEALDFLRGCVGEDKLFLGCGVPLGPSFGVVDACRISCDVDLVYGGKFYNKLSVNREVPSAQNAINNSMFRRHLNGRVFCNDPDVFFLRKDNLTFTMEQKKLLGKINNLFGDVLFVSDNAGDYDDEAIELVKEFFAPSKAEIISVDRTVSSDITIKYILDGQEKELAFNLVTGKVIKQ